MDLEACHRITESYERMADRADVMAKSFYQRLFEAAPDVRPLFPEDMTRQREHLAASLALVARNIEHMDILEEPLMLLGVQHIDYGARPRHYLIVRDVLLEAIAETLGPEQWNEQLRSDWYDALSLIIALMLRGVVASAVDAAKASAGGAHQKDSWANDVAGGG
jgi:hemoglobin-like flavoprotein